jgi:predicted dehydrogenase
LRSQAVTAVAGLLSHVEDIAPPPFADSTRPVGHAGLLADFVRCLREGRTPETVSSDNIRSLAMVFGAIESAETGRAVNTFGVGL